MLTPYEQIVNLKADYFMSVDRKDWERVETLFVEDAEFTGYAFQDAAGAASFVEHLRRFHADTRSLHWGLTPRIAFDSESRARAEWSMRDQVTWPAGSRSYRGVHLPDQYGIEGYGYYTDTCVRVEGVWRIASSRLKRTRIVPLIGADPSLAYDIR